MALECELIDFLLFKSTLILQLEAETLLTETLGCNLEPCSSCAWTKWAQHHPTSLQHAEVPSKPYCFFPGPLCCPSPHAKVLLSFLSSFFSWFSSEHPGWTPRMNWSLRLCCLKSGRAFYGLWRKCTALRRSTRSVVPGLLQPVLIPLRSLLNCLHVWEVSCCPLQSTNTPVVSSLGHKPPPGHWMAGSLSPFILSSFPGGRGGEEGEGRQ